MIKVDSIGLRTDAQRKPLFQVSTDIEGSQFWISSFDKVGDKLHLRSYHLLNWSEISNVMVTYFNSDGTTNGSYRMSVYKDDNSESFNGDWERRDDLAEFSCWFTVFSTKRI